LKKITVTCVPSALTLGVLAVKLAPVAAAVGALPVDVSIVPSELTVKVRVPTPGRVTVIWPGAVPATVGAHLAV